jgi:hypothetical protein
VLEIGGQLGCHLGDPIRDTEARDTIIRKPIRIYRVVRWLPNSRG